MTGDLVNAPNLDLLAVHEVILMPTRPDVRGGSSRRPRELQLPPLEARGCRKGEERRIRK